jgi:hypothetical protein
MFLFHRLWLAPLLMLGFASLPGCNETSAPISREVAAVEPTQAVTRLVSDLRDDNLPGYARHAVPPALYAQLAAAWGEDRSRWPLTELPLHGRLPGLLTTLAEPGAEKALLTVYRRQFAGAHGELRSAAATLGLFAVQYLQREGDYSTEERDHYIQLTGALSQWGKRAPLGDARQAQVAIPQLVSAARLTGLAGEGRFRELGMERSLRRLGPFFGRFKQVLVGYGLDLNAALDSVQITVAEQTGNAARLRLRYMIAGREVDAHVLAERIDGEWYLTDLVRHARAQASEPAATSGTAADRPAR